MRIKIIETKIIKKKKKTSNMSKYMYKSLNIFILIDLWNIYLSFIKSSRKEIRNLLTNQIMYRLEYKVFN